MKSVILLDTDGVLVTELSLSESMIIGPNRVHPITSEGFPFSQVSLRLLHNLHHLTDCDVILTSAWTQETLEKTQTLFRTKGMLIPIVAQFSNPCQGSSIEILKYLKSENYDSWVSINDDFGGDDNLDPNRCIVPNSDYGFVLPGHYEMALDCLRRPIKTFKC